MPGKVPNCHSRPPLECGSSEVSILNRSKITVCVSSCNTTLMEVLVGGGLKVEIPCNRYFKREQLIFLMTEESSFHEFHETEFHEAVIP